MMNIDEWKKVIKPYVENVDFDIDENHVRISINVKDDVLDLYKIQDTRIEYPYNLSFKYEPNQKYTTNKIDANCINKRLIFGDKCFTNETNANGNRAYLGNTTNGIIRKIMDGWLQNKVDYWYSYLKSYNKLYTKDRDDNLLKRTNQLYSSSYLYSQGKVFNPYIADLTGNYRYFKYLLPYCEWMGIPSPLIYECAIECYNEKYGVEPIHHVNITQCRKKDLEREVIKI